jgi:hypothetical protein
MRECLIPQKVLRKKGGCAGREESVGMAIVGNEMAHQARFCRLCDPGKRTYTPRII